MTRDRQIFSDPDRKRWKRLRRIMDVAAVAFTLVVAIFTFNVLRQQHLPELLLPVPKHNYKALKDRQSELQRATKAHERLTHRKDNRKASDVPFNTGEGVRAAYYDPGEAASYSSFKEHVHQIDILFPEWLFISRSDGSLTALTIDNHEFNVVDSHGVHDPDEQNKVKRVIQAAKEDTEVFPHLSSYNNSTRSFDLSIGEIIRDPAKRTNLRQQIIRFLTGLPYYRGLSLISKTCRTTRTTPTSISSRSCTPICRSIICACT